MQRTKIGLLLLLAAAQVIFFLWAVKDVAFAPGYVAQTSDHTTPPYSAELRNYSTLSGTVWVANQDMGKSNPPYGLESPFDFLFRSKLAFLGQAFDKILYAAFLVIGSCGFALLLHAFGLPLSITAYAMALFNFNPGTFSDVINGYFLLAYFSLSLIPWLFLVHVRLVRRAERTLDPLYILLAGGLLFLATSGWSVNFFVGNVLYAAFALACFANDRRRRNALLPLGVTATALVFHLPWILPMVSMANAGTVFKSVSIDEVVKHYTGIFQAYGSTPFDSIIGFNGKGIGTGFVFQFASHLGAWKIAALAVVGVSLAGCLLQAAYKRRFYALYFLALFALAVCLLQGAANPFTVFVYEHVRKLSMATYALMARHVRWYPLYSVGLAGMFAAALHFVWPLCRGRLSRVAFHVAASLFVLAYTLNWWNQDLVKPKQRGSEDLALRAATPLAEEQTLADLFDRDPADYRITVLPTTNELLDGYPHYPGSFLFQRNYDLLGKDIFLGNYANNNVLASLIHYGLNTGYFFTEDLSRCLGLAAVRRLVVLDDPVRTFSHNAFGWMPAHMYGIDRVYRNFDLVRGQALNSAALAPERRLGRLDILRNANAADRVRLVDGVLLSSEEKTSLLPLASSGALEKRAVVYATDMAPGDWARLAPFAAGATPGSTAEGFLEGMMDGFRNQRMAFGVAPTPVAKPGSRLLAENNFLEFFKDTLFPGAVLIRTGSRVTVAGLPPGRRRLLAAFFLFDAEIRLRRTDTGETFVRLPGSQTNNTAWLDLGLANGETAAFEVVSGEAILKDVFAPDADALARALPQAAVAAADARSAVGPQLVFRRDNPFLTILPVRLRPTGPPRDGMRYFALAFDAETAEPFAERSLDFAAVRDLEGPSRVLLLDAASGRTVATQTFSLSREAVATLSLDIPKDCRAPVLQLVNASFVDKPQEGCTPPRLFCANRPARQERVPSPDAAALDSPAERSDVNAKRLNAAAYRVRCERPGQSLLVFSESFDPGWVLCSGLTRIHPIKVNGGAMLFVVPEPGPYLLAYAPFALRLCGLAAAFLWGTTLLLLAWRGRRDRHR